MHLREKSRIRRFLRIYEFIDFYAYASYAYEVWEAI